MINIRIKWKDEPFSLMLDGHANAGRNEHDHDLVCCAVSTLVQTLGVSCVSLPDLNTRYQAQEGHVEILVTGTEAHWDKLVPRFEMAIDGLTVLANQYPQHVTLTVEE